MMDYYEEVKRLCEINGITVDAALKTATNSEVGYTTFWGWKRRNIYPRADIAFKLSKVLGVTVEHFFNDDDAVEEMYMKNKEVIKLFENLSVSSQEKVIDLLKLLQGK